MTTTDMYNKYIMIDIEQLFMQISVAIQDFYVNITINFSACLANISKTRKQLACNPAHIILFPVKVIQS